MDALDDRTRTWPGWRPTHRVPDDGLPAWAAPDGSGPPAVTLDTGLDVTVVERVRDWARVRAVNGWTGWLDGRLLVPLTAGSPTATLSGPMEGDGPRVDAEGRPTSPRYSGDWRILAGGFDGLQVGDDVTVEVDDDWVSLDSDAFAIDVAVDEVRCSGDGSEVRLDVADGRSVLLDWWAADDGDRLRDALLAPVRAADGTPIDAPRPVTAHVILQWAYWAIGTAIILAAVYVLLIAFGGLADPR